MILVAFRNVMVVKENTLKFSHGNLAVSTLYCTIYTSIVQLLFYHYRIFLLPLLPTSISELHSIKSEDLADLHLIFHLDETTLTYSIRQLAQGVEWPFITPLNTQHPSPASGMGSYVPICYQSYLKITYQHNRPLPPNLFQETVNCTSNDLLCPHHIYSGVSRHKYPVGTHMQAFKHKKTDTQQKDLDLLLNYMSIPITRGPSSSRCQLKCVEICANCRRTLFVSQSAGVVTSMKVRVFATASSTLLKNWNQILLTMHWDYSLTPQVDKLPIGSFFGVTGSTSEHNGATMGHADTSCSYADSYLDLPKKAATGYFYFPMPYWKKALIVVDGSESIMEPLQICYQIESTPNYYDSTTTGHFHAKRYYYGEETNGWRSMLTLENFWGHIVAVVMETDNLKAREDGPLSARWAALQADPVLYIDGSKSATMLGTGLEDYFSYSHGFSLAENTSYAFVGVPYTSPYRKEPLTWHSYRLHILDPIPFHSSCVFVMEGTNTQNFTFPEPTLSYKNYWEKLHKHETVFSHLVMYYAKESSQSLTITDVIQIGNEASEQQHSFKIVKQTSKQCGAIFSSLNKEYLGNVLYRRLHDVQGRIFNIGDEFEFLLTVDVPNEGVILRREFETEVQAWNEMAKVSVNDVEVSLWFIPMGTLSATYTLRQEDFMFHTTDTLAHKRLKITIKPKSLWKDVSYTILTVL